MQFSEQLGSEFSFCAKWFIKDLQWKISKKKKNNKKKINKKMVGKS